MSPASVRQLRKALVLDGALEDAKWEVALNVSSLGRHLSGGCVILAGGLRSKEGSSA